MKLAVLASVVLVSSFAVACGGRFTEIADQEDGGGNDDGGASDGGGSDGNPSDGGQPDAPPSSCPASVPSDLSRCARNGMECEYGTDFNPRCDVLATCQQGTFHVTPPLPSGCPTPDPGVGPGCPDTFRGVTQGAKCEPFGLECSYPDGRCACTVTGGPFPADAGSGSWHCVGGGACPYPRPRVGSACSTNGLACDYGGCFLSGGTTMTCQGGAWAETPSACPL